MKKTNEEWHRNHRMGKNVSIEQRIRWHIEHQKNCACREMPETIKQELKRRGTRLER